MRVGERPGACWETKKERSQVSKVAGRKKFREGARVRSSYQVVLGELTALAFMC